MLNRAYGFDCGAAKGLAMLDAPVSGGVTGAAAGTLTFMVGGPMPPSSAPSYPGSDGEDHRSRRPPRLGQAAKICNNMILGISMIAVSEALVLADSSDSTRKLFDISSKSSGQCWSMTCIVQSRGRCRPTGEPRLPGGLHRRDDAEGPEAGAGCLARPRAERRRSVRMPRRFTRNTSRAARGPRLLGHHPFRP